MPRRTRRVSTASAPSVTQTSSSGWSGARQSPACRRPGGVQVGVLEPLQQARSWSPSRVRGTSEVEVAHGGMLPRRSSAGGHGGREADWGDDPATGPRRLAPGRRGWCGHRAERSRAPVRALRRRDGMQEFVVGTGGRSHYYVKDEQAGAATSPPSASGCCGSPCWTGAGTAGATSPRMARRWTVGPLVARTPPPAELRSPGPTGPSRCAPRAVGKRSR